MCRAEEEEEEGESGDGSDDGEESEGEGEDESESEGEGEGESEGEGEESSSDGLEEELQFEWTVPRGRDGSPARLLRFSSSLFPPCKGTALFPLVSKLNHSCSPNCHVVWSRDCCAKIVAVADLPAGAELTIDYLANGDHGPQASTRRRRWLLEQYGFNCACEACQAIC